MKILIVSQYFWPESFLVNSLALELQKQGHRIEVLTGLPNYPKGELFQGYSFWKGPWTESYEGVSVKRVPLVSRKSGFVRLSINYISFIFFGVIPGLFRTGRDADVIFCFGLSPVTSCIPAIFMKWKLGKPLVFWVQDLWPESIFAVGVPESKLILNLVGNLTRWIYSQCDLILMQSQAFAPSILRWGGQKEKLRYIPNWFQASSSQKISIPAWLSQAPQGFKVVFAGNIGHAQDMKTILRAAEILKDHSEIKWMIVGDGSAKEFVDQQIKSRGLEKVVQTYGRRPVEDMAGLFSVGDLMLVTLTNESIFALTVPSKIQAYMSASKPILAALNGEGARVVEEAGAGLSCPSESPEKLAERILEFAKMSPEQLKQTGAKGKAYFEKNFEQALVVGKIGAICESVINSQLLK